MNPIIINTVKDRISMAGAGQSIQTIILQMAAAKEFGEANYNKFSTLYRNLSHPDGLAAFLSGTEITAYFSSPPFQYQALEKPNVRRILNSYDITGGPATFLVASADEIHQCYLPNRTGTFTDVLLDCAGAATLLLILHLTVKPRSPRQAANTPQAIQSAQA